MDIGLAGKVVFVTGAGSGIGRDIALTFAREGARVVVTDINEAAAQACANEVRELGAEAIGIGLDVTSLDAAKAAVAKSVQTYGGVDALVNCAGAWRVNMFVDSTPQDWEFEINTCLMGVINCTRAALDPMIAGGGGKIVNISSDAGRVGEFRQAVYSAAKAGVIGFSKAIAREHGRHGVHVNCVCPGYTKTPATTDGLTDELEARIAKGYPLRKLGVPEDLGKVVVFLASDGASHVTGQTISVSGGYTMV
jgi:2-hydroxycyclohexanecarboxyl-CoA dehydrogenase